MTPQHRNPVNLLRALAILLVVAHHYAHYFEWPIPYAGVYGGLLGVQLFFLISGYLITDTAARRGFWEFMANRAFRIFPTYWVAVIGVSLLAGTIFPVARQDLGSFLLNLLALTHFSPYALLKFDVLTVSWTLTIEWTWYLIAATLAWPLRYLAVGEGTARRYWLAWILAFLALSTGWVLLVPTGRLDPWFAGPIARIGISPINDHMRTAFMLSAAPAQWVFFAIGLGLRVFRDRLAQLPPWLCLGVGAGALAWPALWPLGAGLHPSFITGIALAGVFLWFRADPLGLNHSALARPLHRVGDWSYPLYLVHVPVMLTLKHHFGVGGALGLLYGLAASLGVSLALHVWVENPGRRLGQRLRLTSPATQS